MVNTTDQMLLQDLNAERRAALEHSFTASSWRQRRSSRPDGGTAVTHGGGERSGLTDDRGCPA